MNRPLSFGTGIWKKIRILFYFNNVVIYEKFFPFPLWHYAPGPFNLFELEFNAKLGILPETLDISHSFYVKSCCYELQ